MPFGRRALVEDINAVSDSRLLVAVDAPPFRGVGIRLDAREQVAELVERPPAIREGNGW